MANYPNVIDTFAQPIGTQNLDNPDHSLDHRNLGSATVGIENALGTTLGTSVLKSFAAGDQAVRHQGGTLQIAHIGTFNNSTFGTPVITGGNFNNLTIGTPAITGGTATNMNYNNGTIGTPTLQAWNGWMQETGSWLSVGTDTLTGTLAIVKDVTSIYQAGMRIKMSVGGSTQYGIISSVGAFSGGSTTFTVFSGTYAYGTTAITSPFYSPLKLPFGFSANPSDWTVETSDTTDRSQSTPGAGTWYNIGTMTITIPIGLWRTEYFVVARMDTGGNTSSMQVTLGTVNNSVTDADFTTEMGAAASEIHVHTMTKAKILSLAAKTTYYLNAMSDSGGATAFYFRNSSLGGKMFIRAINAYL